MSSKQPFHVLVPLKKQPLRQRPALFLKPQNVYSFLWFVPSFWPLPCFEISLKKAPLMPEMIYQIDTPQTTPHAHLAKRVQKHLKHPYQKPFSPRQLASFEEVNHWITKMNRPIILDSGCGTGQSTFNLAQQFKLHAIVGIDKSSHRLKKNSTPLQPKPNNCFLVQANLEDIWRLILKANWNITHHFMFYPNPWPKPEHLQRRWHGHPVFPDLIRLSPYLEVRTNWKLYLDEFAQAVQIATGIWSEPYMYKSETPISLFEKKYWENNCETYAYKLLMSS